MTLFPSFTDMHPGCVKETWIHVLTYAERTELPSSKGGHDAFDQSGNICSSDDQTAPVCILTRHFWSARPNFFWSLIKNVSSGYKRVRKSWTMAEKRRRRTRVSCDGASSDPDTQSRMDAGCKNSRAHWFHLPCFINEHAWITASRSGPPVKIKDSRLDNKYTTLLNSNAPWQ